MTAQYYYEARGKQIFKVESGRDDQNVGEWPDAETAMRRADEYNSKREDASQWSDCPSCGGIKGMSGGGRCDCEE